MDGVAAGDAHSVSAVAVIDLGGGGGAGSGGRGSGGNSGHSGHSGHGLVAGHSVVVIGGEEHELLGHGHTPEDDEEDDEDDDADDDADDGGCGCGEDCGHDEDGPHLLHMGPSSGHSGHHSPSSDASSSHGGTSASGSSKRKRVVLSIHEKQQVLQRLDMGEQPVVLSRDFGISRQQVSDIKKNRARILAFCLDATHLSSLRRKTLKATTEFHPGVEQELYRWLIRQRKLGRGVSPDALMHKATDLFMQYAADDAANVSFRSVHVWLRHFKRAHNIRTMDPSEIARLPATFTPAMDMGGASRAHHGGPGAADSSSANEDSEPTPQSTAVATAPVAQPQVPAADDVSSYMTNMDLAPPSAHQQHHASATSHQSFLLQNHAPPMGDVNAVHSYQMLMLSSASLVAEAATATTTTSMTPAAVATSMGLPVQDAPDAPNAASPLHSCVQLAQKMNAELSRFEHDMALKLETLDARVGKLCFSVLATAGAATATTTSASHLHTTSSRFA